MPEDRAKKLLAATGAIAAGLGLSYLVKGAYAAPVCGATCEAACQAGCEVQCQAPCLAQCQVQCEVGVQTCIPECETYCQVECEAQCQGACEVTCQYQCEAECQTACEAVEQVQPIKPYIDNVTWPDRAPAGALRTWGMDVSCERPPAPAFKVMVLNQHGSPGDLRIRLSAGSWFTLKPGQEAVLAEVPEGRAYPFWGVTGQVVFEQRGIYKVTLKVHNSELYDSVELSTSAY